MKHLSILFFCCAAVILSAADAIVPPAGGTVKTATAGKISGQQGGFAVDFTLDFTDPDKDYVGYTVSCRNWKKPIRGFCFGVNRIKGSTSIWFYPLDENGKAFGFYKKYPLETGKRYHAEITWKDRQCKLTIDGRAVTGCRLREEITVFDTIEIGGLGGKNHGVTVHEFRFLETGK